MSKIFDGKINAVREMTTLEQQEYDYCCSLFFKVETTIEERIEEMAQQLINAQEALDFLIMGGL